jgi:myo-inositol-1-phosphate synthase
MFPQLGPPQAIRFAGWDVTKKSLTQCLKDHRVVPDELWAPYKGHLSRVEIREAPSATLDLSGQVVRLSRDMQAFRRRHLGCRPVLVNLLPACGQADLGRCRSISQLHAKVDPAAFPDLAYMLAAVQEGMPVVNFTPNAVEAPAVVQEARKQGVPMAGRDAKTGQTYLKVVLASALKARNLTVEGWYSLNILGNADGRNLTDPAKAAGKLANKTEVLDDVLRYRVGNRYGVSTHKVHIDYYPPRGDSKEAWDVIDFTGLFGLPMSMRLNLMARDSILAAPLVIDLARWMAALQMAGRSGLVPELALFFKRPLGPNPPSTFQDQLAGLGALEQAIGNRQ